MAAEEERAVTSRAFSAYGCALEMVTYLRYLGQVILAAYNDWPEVVSNLSRSRAVWKRTTRILSREVVELRLSRFFFKSMVQAVLICVSETWVVKPRMGRALGRYQDQVARRLTGRLPRRKTDEKCE